VLVYSSSLEPSARCSAARSISCPRRRLHRAVLNATSLALVAGSRAVVRFLLGQSASRQCAAVVCVGFAIQIGRESSCAICVTPNSSSGLPRARSCRCSPCSSSRLVRHAAARLGFALHWLVMTVSGRSCHAVVRRSVRMAARTFRYQRAVETSFRPDRESRGDAPDMLIFDQLRKAIHDCASWRSAFCGRAHAAGGLWYHQVLSARITRRRSSRNPSAPLRVPAIRGKILDRNAFALAENRPNYKSTSTSTSCARV